MITLEEKWTPEDTYIIIILGSNPSYTSQRGKALKESPDNDSKVLNLDEKLPNSITKKYINYYMTSNGILIKRLAHFFNIPPKNVKILAKGTKEDFSVCSLTNEKLYLQLDARNIYETGITSDELDFIYFIENDIGNALEMAFDDIPIKSRILCFLDDNGFSNSFANIPLLKIYITLQANKPTSLRLFNDSFYSGSLIDLIEKYYKFTDAASKVKGRVSLYQLMILTKIANKLGTIKIMKTPKNERRAEREYYQLTNIFDVIKEIQKMIDLGIDNVGENNETSFKIIMEFFKELLVKVKINNFFGDMRPISELSTLRVAILGYKTSFIIQTLGKFGFQTFNDMYNFYQIVETYNKLNSKPIFARDLFKLYNKRNVEQLIEISKAFNCADSKEFYNVLYMFEIQNVPIENYLYHIPQDYSIITSVFPHGKSVTFGSRRIEGTNRKVVFGSPAFGAFINEVFFNITDKPIDVKNIRKEAAGIKEEEDKEEIEYAAVCPNKKRQRITTEWNRLNIQQKKYGDLSNERFFSDELIKEHLTKDEILSRIGFKLVQAFEEDGETPIVDVMKDGTPRHRIRRSGKPIDMNQNEISVDIEYDEYYSDDEIYNDGNSLKSSTPSESSSSAASEPEDDHQYVTLKRGEAEKIVKKLGIPAVSWGVDAHRFIIMALTKKSKELEEYLPFNPNKDIGELYNGFYDWANSSMSKYIDVCQIYDAHRLVLRISDWANDNLLIINYEFDILEQLIKSICQLAKEYITGAYDISKCR